MSMESKSNLVKWDDISVKPSHEASLGSLPNLPVSAGHQLICDCEMEEQNLLSKFLNPTAMLPLLASAT